MSFEVFCEDNAKRHEGTFATRQEALQFAEWGHICTNLHTVRQADHHTERQP